MRDGTGVVDPGLDVTGGTGVGDSGRGVRDGTGVKDPGRGVRDSTGVGVFGSTVVKSGSGMRDGMVTGGMDDGKPIGNS